MRGFRAITRTGACWLWWWIEVDLRCGSDCGVIFVGALIPGEEKLKNLLFSPLFLLHRPQLPDLRSSYAVANDEVTGALIRLTLAMSKRSMAGFLCFVRLIVLQISNSGCP